jgi:thioredoxin 1
VRLEIDGESVIDNPAANDVRDALLRLNQSGPMWAILDIVGSHYYIQTHTSGYAFAMEYREGGADRHYGTGGVRREAVIDAFLDYLADGNRWRTAFQWRRLDLGMTGPTPVTGVICPAIDAGFEAVYTSREPVLVAFMAETGSACRALRPILTSLACEQAGRLHVIMADVDAKPAVAQAWGITEVPVMLLFHQGVLQRVLHGVRPYAQLIQEIEEKPRALFADAAAFSHQRANPQGRVPARGGAARRRRVPARRA